MALYGTDQSKWQSNNIIEGDFGIFKATEGVGYVDPSCDIKYQKHKKAGKKLGVYHFARPDGNSAKREAEFFVNNIKGYLHEAILVLDWEKNVWDVNWAKQWLDKVYELTGIRPIIYMSASVVKNYNWSAVAKNYGLWIAGYPAKYNVKNPPKPSAHEMPYSIGAWKFAALWQYSSSAGTLDRDIAYMDTHAWDLYAGKKQEQKPCPKPIEPVKPTPNQEQPKPLDPPKPAKPEEDDNANTPEQPESTDKGLTAKEWGKVNKKLQDASEKSKKAGVHIEMSNKVYDTLKIIVLLVLPIVQVAYATLSEIWGFSFSAQINDTITLVINICETLLGAALIKSSADYKKKLK